MVRRYSLDLVFMLETKSRGRRAKFLVRRLGFPNSSFIVDSEGLKGGLMLMWKEEIVVPILSYSKCQIDALITDK